MLFFQLFAAFVGAALFFWTFIALLVLVALLTENWPLMLFMMMVLLIIRNSRSRKV